MDAEVASGLCEIKHRPRLWAKKLDKELEDMEFDFDWNPITQYSSM